jgi:hypothetical protein
MRSQTFLFPVLISAFLLFAGQSPHEHLWNSANAQQQVNIVQTTAVLSQQRCLLAATSSGELAFFGGGYYTVPFTGSAQVDICNVTSGSWTTATLSVGRGDLAAASSGNLVIFAGGWNGTTLLNQVDIYNISDGSWHTATLSVARADFAAASVGSLVLLGGGWDDYTDVDVVDIYNVTVNTWTTATLSQSRSYLAAIAVANRYAIFAGGSNASTALNSVDIYDSMSGLWDTTTLSRSRGDLTATSLGNLAFFAGGDNGTSVVNGAQTYNTVDIFNATSRMWTTATLSQARTWLAAASIGDIVAFGGGSSNSSTASATIDMYNVTSGIWLNATLSQPLFWLAATASVDSILFGGGVNNYYQFSDIVDIFQETNFLTPQPTNVPFSSPFVPSFVPLQNISNTTSLVVVGIDVGGIAFLLVLGIILFLILFIKRRKQHKKKQKEHHSLESVGGQAKEGQILPTDVTNESTQYATISPTQIREDLREQDKLDKWREDNDMIQTSGVDTMKRNQIPFVDLEIEKELDKGSYGRVCLGRWNDTIVALKFCKETEGIDDFIKEAYFMIELPSHPHVVQVYGISVDGPQVVLVLEYCARGSLSKLLFDNNQPLSKDEKIDFVKGIARGMLHLHNHNIIHRDLAARNILLSSTGVPKISDFGMSRVLTREDEEGKTKTNIGPIRWMAPESIANRIYSKKSDIWSFGIVVWEIVARSEPHSKIDIFDAAIQIRDGGLVPTIPEDCPPLLRETMEMCWKQQADERPTFKEICRLLGK